MTKKIVSCIIVILCLCSCKTASWKTTSFDLMTKNQVNCFDVLNNHSSEDIYFIKNKEFKKISKFLRKNYNVTYIRNVFYIKSREQYYCEFNINNYTINCLFVDKNFEVISFEEFSFDL